MNQKNYSEIARIIKEAREFNTGSLEDAWGYKFNDVLLPKLADYFEREDKENQPTKNIWNREQFLKDCGVIEK